MKLASMSRVRVMSAVVCLTAAVLVGGCGGNAPPTRVASTGALAISVNWPAPVTPAFIPAAAEAVAVTLSNQGSYSFQTTVARPAAGGTSIITVDGVPTGPIHVHFGAYSALLTLNDMGAVAPGGDLLAWAVHDIVVAAGQANEVVFSLTDRPAYVVLTTGGASTELVEGQTLQVFATGYDGDGNVLAVPSWAWSSSDTGVANVDGSGLVEAVEPGITNIRAAYGGVSGQLPVTVLSPPQINLEADKTEIKYGETITLQWTSTGATSVVDSNFGANDVNGELTINPFETTVYTITVAGPGGESTAVLAVIVTGTPAIVGSVSAQSGVSLRGM